MTECAQSTYISYRKWNTHRLQGSFYTQILCISSDSPLFTWWNIPCFEGNTVLVGKNMADFLFSQSDSIFSWNFPSFETIYFELNRKKNLSSKFSEIFRFFFVSYWKLFFFFFFAQIHKNGIRINKHWFLQWINFNFYIQNQKFILKKLIVIEWIKVYNWMKYKNNPCRRYYWANTDEWKLMWCVFAQNFVFLLLLLLLVRCGAIDWFTRSSIVRFGSVHIYVHVSVRIRADFQWTEKNTNGPSIWNPVD